MSIIKGTKSVREAADEIGVTRQTLRRWIEAYAKRCPTGRGKPKDNECKAGRVEDPMFPNGFVYQVPVSEIDRLRSAPKSYGPGRPRLSESA